MYLRFERSPPYFYENLLKLMLFETIDSDFAIITSFRSKTPQKLVFPSNFWGRGQIER